MKQPVSNRHAWAMGAAGLALLVSWWVSPFAADGMAPVAPVTRPDTAATGLAGSTALPVAAVDAGPAALPPAAGKSAAALALVPITLTAPQKLQVGEQNELAIAIGATAALGEVSFTVRFDPDVLQARAAMPGEGLTGAGPGVSFTVDIPDAADRVHVRSVAADGRASTIGRTVALVHFQAVGPGVSKVSIADVTVKDPSGRSLPVLLSRSDLLVSAEAAPTRPADLARPPFDAPATEAVDGGD